PSSDKNPNWAIEPRIQIDGCLTDEGQTWIASRGSQQFESELSVTGLGDVADQGPTLLLLQQEQRSLRGIGPGEVLVAVPLIELPIESVVLAKVQPELGAIVT